MAVIREAVPPVDLFYVHVQNLGHNHSESDGCQEPVYVQELSPSRYEICGVLRSKQEIVST